MAFDLAACRALLDLSEEHVRRQFAAGEVQEDVRYEGLFGLTMFYHPATFPARIYVGGGRVQMVYVSSGPLLEGVTEADLAAQLGGEGTRLRSRAGKAFTHYVYAEQGVAYSSDGDELAFIEVFPPRSQAAYVAEIYREPARFIL